MRVRRQQRVVYCAYNFITDKSYIGWCIDFKERKARHIRGTELGSKTRFHNALRKYGPSAFQWFILRDNLESQEECKRVEKIMICLFDTYYNGYNSTLGGDGGFTGYNSGQFKKGHTRNIGSKRSLETIDRLRRSHIGKIQPLEQIAKRVAKLKGRVRSLETRKKISKTLCKPVIQLTKNMQLIASFPSIKEAVKITGVNNIGATCNGRHRTAGGFVWKFKNEQKKCIVTTYG